MLQSYTNLTFKVVTNRWANIVCMNSLICLPSLFHFFTNYSFPKFTTVGTGEEHQCHNIRRETDQGPDHESLEEEQGAVPAAAATAAASEGSGFPQPMVPLLPRGTVAEDVGRRRRLLLRGDAGFLHPPPLFSWSINSGHSLSFSFVSDRSEVRMGVRKR